MVSGLNYTWKATVNTFNYYTKSSTATEGKVEGNNTSTAEEADKEVEPNKNITAAVWSNSDKTE